MQAGINKLNLGINNLKLGMDELNLRCLKKYWKFELHWKHSQHQLLSAINSWYQNATFGSKNGLKHQIKLLHNRNRDWRTLDVAFRIPKSTAYR